MLMMIILFTVFIDNSWVIAFKRSQSELAKLKGSRRPPLDANILMEEVHPRYQSETHAVDRLEDLSHFEKYVKQMIVHHMPRRFDQADQEEFEILIEKLLAKGHVIGGFDVFPNYNEEFSRQVNTQN